MEKLPLELLQQVLQYLPRSDLPSVRLLTRTLAAAAEPLLFHTIPLWIELQSVKALTGISEHPRLSQYVKEIVFSPLRFIEHEDRSLYQAEVRNALEYESVSLSSHMLYLEHYLSSSKLHLEQHMAAYDSFRAGQSYLAANSSDVKFLSHAFGKLPHFKHLVVDYFSEIAVTRLYKIFGGPVFKPYCVEYSPVQPYFVECSGEYGLPVLLKALASSGVGISTFRIGPSGAPDSTWSDPDNRFRSPRPFPVLAAEETISHALYKTFRRPNKNAYSETLRVLRVLEVSETRFKELNQDIVDWIIDVIGTIVSWASHIESIAVPQFGVYGFDDSETPLMSNLFQTSHLKKLKKLKLESFNTTLSYLTLFFRRYGKQLEEIDFEGVNVSDAEWSTALYHLRAIEFPNLVTFDVDLVDVYDYVTGVTDIIPIEDYSGPHSYRIMPSTQENDDRWTSKPRDL